MLDLQDLKSKFKNIDFREKRPNLYKVLIPYFHEDGDMYDIFIQEAPGNKGLIRICDYGLTLMKLSYTFDIDSPNKQTIVEDIIAQNRGNFDDGNIFIDVAANQFQNGIYQFCQIISKVSNVDILSREIIKSCFYEMLANFFDNKIKPIFPGIQNNICPLQDQDYKVDFAIPQKKPIYIFGIRDNAKAGKVVISCLSFQKANLPYQSLAIHENFENLDKYYKNQITNTVDKQFTSLSEFEKQGCDYLQRQIS